MPVLADLQLAGLHAEVDLDDAIAEPHRVGIHREDRRKRLHLAAEEIEPGAVARALDALIVELALAERAGVEPSLLREVRNTNARLRGASPTAPAKVAIG